MKYLVQAKDKVGNGQRLVKGKNVGILKGLFKRTGYSRMIKFMKKKKVSRKHTCNENGSVYI